MTHHIRIGFYAFINILLDGLLSYNVYQKWRKAVGTAARDSTKCYVYILIIYTSR